MFLNSEFVTYLKKQVVQNSFPLSVLKLFVFFVVYLIFWFTLQYVEFIFHKNFNKLDLGKIMKNIYSTLIISTTLAVAGCATPPDKIEASYVSPIQYENYTCEQIGQEATRVSERASQALGVQKKKAQSDAVKVGVALVLFWPAALFVSGKGANETEVARLKGEMDTLQKVAIQKECGIEFQQPEPTGNINEAADLTVQDS